MGKLVNFEYKGFRERLGVVQSVMEAEKLISRVEQQCSLIAMLKQRADRAHEQVVMS